MANVIPIKVNTAEGIVEQFGTTDGLLADAVERRSDSGNLVIGATLDTIEATGSVTVAGLTTATNTITINGNVLTAVAGARTPGSDDFSISSGTTAGIAADIVAALNDGANSFTGDVVAVLNGSIVELTAVPTGSAGNSITLATSDAVNFTLSGATLSGGSEEELQLGSSTGVVAIQGDLTVAGSSTISVDETVTGNFSVEGDTSLGTGDGDTIDLGGGTGDTVNLNADLVVGSGTIAIGSGVSDYLDSLWLDAVNTNGPALAAYDLNASGTNAGAYAIGVDPSLLSNSSATDLMTALDNLDAAITAAGADTLQTAYAAGNTIDVTAGNGTLGFSNDNAADTTTVLTVSRTPGSATGGNGIDVTMGANTTGLGINLTGTGSGDLLFVNNGGTGDAIDIQDGGTSVFQVTGAGAVNVTPTSGQSYTLTTAGAGVVDINSASDITIDSTGAGVSIGAAGASDFTTTSGSLTLEAAAGVTVKDNGGTITLDAVSASGDGTVVITNTGATPTGADLEFAVAGSQIVRSGDSVAAIDVADLVDKTAAETITGGWTFSTADVTVSGVATGYVESAGDPTTATDTGFLYTKDDGGDTELFWKDAAGNVLQVTLDGALNIGDVTETLQEAYEAGNTIAVTTANGAIQFSNDTDATNVLEISRNPAGATAGIGASIVMGANCSGDALFVNNSGSGDAIDIQDGGTSVFQVTGAGAVNVTPTSGQNYTLTAAGAGTVGISAAADVTIDSTGAGVSIDAAAASNFSTSAGNLTLDAAAGELVFDDVGNSGITLSQASDRTLDLTGSGELYDGVTSIIGAFNALGVRDHMTKTLPIESGVTVSAGYVVAASTTSGRVDAGTGGSGGNKAIIGIALSGGTGDAGGTVLCTFVLPGAYVTVTGGSFTPGTPVFAPTSAGPPVDSFTGGTGDRNIRLGYAITSTDIVFDPAMGFKL